MTSIESLIGKHLRKAEPDIEKARKSIEIGEKNLQKAKSIFNMHIDDVALLVGYYSLFHTARALLFKDGFKDQSHWGVVEYLRIKYKEKLGESTINKLDTFRILRNSTAYGLESKADREEAKELLLFAEQFIEKVKKLI